MSAESKGDLISREALRNEVDSWGCNDFDKYDFLDAIDNAPTVNPFERIGTICNENCGVYRPHGKWIKQEWGYVCSVCGVSNDYAYDNNIHKFTDYFCPNCGAKMEGGEEE